MADLTKSLTTNLTITEQNYSSPYLNTFDPNGSAAPLPVLKWICTSTPTTAITQIVFLNTTTGDTITVSSLAMDSIGDYLEIDTEEMTVKVSHDGDASVEVDFTGVFPRFISGSNSYSVTITGSTIWDLTQTITYYPLYL